MAIAGTLANIGLDTTEGMDKISTTEKVTSPYFSNGATELIGANIVTSSLSDTNETYFFGISHADSLTVEEFDVAFGSTNGFGSKKESNTKAETSAIYKQFASTLLAPTEITGGFFISSPATEGVVTGKDEEIFILTAKRSNMKDRINKGSWELNFSGSRADGTHAIFHYIDDSKNENPTATPVGDRYNIVSGSGGNIVTESTERNYGFFYPDMGILVFSAQELSASMPGSQSNAHNQLVEFRTGSLATAGTSFSSFGYGKLTNLNQQTALRFVNCLNDDANLTKMSFRDEEDQVSAQYFCRVRSAHANFSNNPTFVSGSLNELRQTKMKGNPQTFISSVQLYNTNGDIVAVGNLSKPLKKNFSSEATIKVKLTY